MTEKTERRSPRVALITAGSRGLGADIARALARDGTDVAITYVKDAKTAESLAKSLEDAGVRAKAYQADASDFARAQVIAAEVRADFGGLHILVCCAGMARSVALQRMTEADWDDPVNVTLKGTFNYVRAVSGEFARQRYGKIVCIGSINGLRGRVGTLSYNAAKAGLSGLVKTAAAELGQFDINVNLVAPGFMESSSQVSTSEVIRTLVLNECAIKRLGTPADVTPLVQFLVSDAARHITGQVIKADAGQYL